MNNNTEILIMIFLHNFVRFQKLVQAKKKGLFEKTHFLIKKTLI